LVSQSPTAPQSTEALADPIEDSISVSSNSPSISQQSPGSSADNSVVAEDDEETDTDEVQVVEKPKKKRARGMFRILYAKRMFN
jgi:hypothetical protein